MPINPKIAVKNRINGKIPIQSIKPISDAIPKKSFSTTESIILFNVLNLFLKEKDTIACFCYSEEDEEIPFLIANKNYVQLFNDDIHLKNNMLLVPKQYKDISLYRYKLDKNVDIQFIND